MRWMRHCYRIEYQKHGLLLSHLLLFSNEDNHFLCLTTIDKIICFEFLSQEANPELYSIITATIVHNPCSN
jgi:hypothetical protein